MFEFRKDTGWLKRRVFFHVFPVPVGVDTQLGGRHANIYTVSALHVRC